MKRGDVAIDCGANIGEFTTIMARSGATVYAFEPHPTAFLELQRNTAAFSNVVAINAAVTCRTGRVKLFLHERSDNNPLYWSTGASLLHDKPNVDAGNWIEVEGVALAEFIAARGQRVRLMKMDIEGHEIEVVNGLLDSCTHEVIDAAFVEVHDRKIAHLVAPTASLRDRLRQMGVDQFHLDWD